MTEMEFGLLGPLLVCQGGVVLPVRRGNQRTVLASLLLDANRAVSVDAIAEALWGPVPPPSAPVTVRNYVRRLRQALGDDGRERIRAQPYGYVIRVAAGELDVSRFEALLETARMAARHGAWEQAAARARAALALWRGEPLADVESATLALREVPRLLELRWQALETRIDADLRLGAHAEVIAELRRLAVAHPLREQVHGSLMLALYRSGRAGEALAAYQYARTVLAGELGTEPGTQLQHLHQQILTAAPALSGPVPALSVFQLPAAPADFTGRRAECEIVLDTVAQDDRVPVVAISGLPGTGKTALALYAAHRARDRFPDGQLWVPLAGASGRPRDPGEVLGELLRVSGIPGSAVPDSQAERAAAFRSQVAGRRLLVVADDAASAGQVAPLLPGTPGCAVIVTSRMRLEGLAGARLLPLDVMTRAEAVGLLARILGPARVAAEPVGVGELADACGELPLALRVAGAKLAARPTWPVSAMTRRLTRAHSRLRELETENLSVCAGIATSYDLLPEHHQRAFRFLSILGPSDFAEWVVPALLGEPDSAGVLDELLSRSLVTPTGVDRTGEPRYRLHDLLCDYAAERLAEQPPPGTQAATGRLLAAYLQLARTANAGLPPEPYFPPPVFTPRPAVLPANLAEQLTADPITWFTSERQNLLAAVDWACTAGLVDVARELAGAQCAYQHLHDRHDDAQRLWSAIADRSDQHDAYPSLRVGASLVERGRAAEALPILDLSVGQAGAAEVQALALYWRGACAWDLDDFNRARQDADHGLAAARRAGSPLAELLNLRLRSNALAQVGACGEAVLVAESALAIAESLGAATYELAALHNLAYSCALAGQYDRSVRVCHRRIELSRELGDVRGEAHCHGVLGDAYYGQGEWELAIQSLRRALPVFEERRALRHYAVCLYKIGRAYEGLGSCPEAIGYLNSALHVFRQLDLSGKAQLAQQALDRCRAGAVPPLKPATST